MSRICADIDVQVQAFLSRPLQASGYAYLYIDATYLHGRLGRATQVCSRAIVVAMGVNADGRQEPGCPTHLRREIHVTASSCV